MRSAEPIIITIEDSDSEEEKVLTQTITPVNRGATARMTSLTLPSTAPPQAPSQDPSVRAPTDNAPPSALRIPNDASLPISNGARITPNAQATSPASMPKAPSKIVQVDDPMVARLANAISETSDAVKRAEYRLLQKQLGRIEFECLPGGRYKYLIPCKTCMDSDEDCILPNPLAEKGRSCELCRKWHNQCNGGGMVPLTLPLNELRSWLVSNGRIAASKPPPPPEKRSATTAKPDRPKKQRLSLPSQPAPTSSRPPKTHVQPTTSATVKPTGWREVSATHNTTQLCDILESNLEYYEEMEMRVASTRAAIDQLRNKSNEFSPVAQHSADILIRAPRLVQRLESILATTPSSKGIHRAIKDFKAVAEAPF